jgi:hypothetical protein
MRGIQPEAGDVTLDDPNGAGRGHAQTEFTHNAAP